MQERVPKRSHLNLMKVPKCPTLEPEITFRTLHKHLIERWEKEVNDGEPSSILDKDSVDKAEYPEGQQPKEKQVSSFWGLDKRYSFLQDSHVQETRFQYLLELFIERKFEKGRANKKRASKLAHS